MDKQLHSCYTNKGKSKEIVLSPSPPAQISVSNDPSWLDQILNAEEEELEEVLAATLSSGTAYYASTSGSSSSFPAYSSLPEGSSVNSTTLPISAPPTLSDVVKDHPIVRITKPLPKRDLKSRFPNALRVTKPLPKHSLRSRFPSAIRAIKPLPKRISNAHSLNDSKTHSFSTSMDVDNQTSFRNQPESDATMKYQPSWQQEADDYTMNEDENHTRLPTSIIFGGSKDRLAKRSTVMSTYPVEEPTVYGSLFEQVDPWDTIGQILGLSNTTLSKSLGEMIDELDELDESEEWLQIRSAIAANLTGTNDALPTQSPDDSDMDSTNIPSQALQTVVEVNLNNESLDQVDFDSESSDGVDSDNESLDEVQIGDNDERDTGIYNAAVPTGLIVGRSTSTEFCPNRVTVNDSISLPKPPRSTSVSIDGPTLWPNGKEGFTFASHPNPSQSAPENDIGALNWRKQNSAGSNPQRFDNASVDNPSSGEPVQSTSSVPAVIVTRSANRSPPSPDTYLAPSFLSALALPKSPALPSMLQPVVPNNSNVPTQANVAWMCPAPYTYTGVSTIDTQALDAITPTAIIKPQPHTTHVLSAFYQDNPELMHIFFDAQNMSFQAPEAGQYAQISYEASDVDMCLDMSLDPLYLPDYHSTPINTLSNAPEMWSDMQQDPNEDEEDPMNLMDFDDPMTSWSDPYGQSYLAHLETAHASNWYHAELTKDVEMGSAILAEPEPEVTYDDRRSSTPATHLVIMEDPDSYFWEEEKQITLPNNANDSPSELSLDLSMPNIAIALEALVDAPVTTETQSLIAEAPSYQICTKVHQAHQEEVTEPVSPQPRTTKVRNISTSMTIPPLHPASLMGDMSAFMQQISTIVNTLDSLTSLKLETQDFAAIQTTAAQLVSAANGQPTAYGRVFQSPESKTPADAPDRDFCSVDRNSVENEPTQPEAELYDPSRSTPNRGLTRYGRWPVVNHPLTTIPSSGREVHTPDLDENTLELALFSDLVSERDFTTTTAATVSSKAQSEVLSKSAAEISLPRTRHRLRLTVDIANTWVAFETETSGTQFQTSASSIALCLEVSKKSILQPDIAVKTQSFWSSLWGALTSLISPWHVTFPLSISQYLFSLCNCCAAFYHSVSTGVKNISELG